MKTHLGYATTHGLLIAAVVAQFAWGCSGGSGGGTQAGAGTTTASTTSASPSTSTGTILTSSTTDVAGTSLASSTTSASGSSTSQVQGTQSVGTTASTSTSNASGSSGASGAVSFASDRVVVTGIRNVATPAAQSVINLHNGGTAAVQVTNLALSGTDAAQFTITTTTPASIAAGADLAVTVEMATTGAGLPATPPGPAPYNSGSNLSEATLTVTTSAGTAQASVYGLLLVQMTYESTLGQILTTLGYKLNVGQAQNDWNPNTSMMATTLPGIETGTDEVAAPLFVKAGTGTVGLNVVARFSPEGALPYGWYPSTSPTTMNMVGTMSDENDPQTSNKARMVLPPLQAGSATTFDPGTASFGLWIYSDQKSQKFGEGGNMVNGDYDYSQDALNSPANVHRIKVYPLKDATGAAIAQSYLIAVEEAANGDYQDYVFVLSNVNVAP